MDASFEQYLFHRGELTETYKYLGAHPSRTSTIFRVWAPNAKSVAIVGDFNNWIPRDIDFCKRITEAGVWEVEILKLKKGNIYKFRIEKENGEMVLKSDPYAFYSELRPNTASIVYGLPKFRWGDKRWLNKRKLDFTAPINIYEVHLGSWLLKDNGTFYNYRELAEKLAEYLNEMNYTHIEIMPITEYPFDAS